MAEPTFHIGDIVKRLDRDEQFTIEALDSQGEFVYDQGYNAHATRNIVLVERQLPIKTSELIPAPEPADPELGGSDPVEQPSHYKTGRFEAIDVIEEFGLSRDFRLGNAAKYLLRAGKKDSELQDLKKARQYLNRYISSLEGEPSW